MTYKKYPFYCDQLAFIMEEKAPFTKKRLDNKRIVFWSHGNSPNRHIKGEHFGGYITTALSCLFAPKIRMEKKGVKSYIHIVLFSIDMHKIISP